MDDLKTNAPTTRGTRNEFSLSDVRLKIQPSEHPELHQQVMHRDEVPADLSEHDRTLFVPSLPLTMRRLGSPAINSPQDAAVPYRKPCSRAANAMWSCDAAGSTTVPAFARGTPFTTPREVMIEKFAARSRSASIASRAISGLISIGSLHGEGEACCGIFPPIHVYCTVSQKGEDAHSRTP